MTPFGGIRSFGVSHGITGTDHFSDYSQNTGGDSKEAKKKGKSASGGRSGAVLGVTAVPQGTRRHIAREVARCEFFKTSKKVPDVDSNVFLRPKTDRGRLAIESGRPKKIVGYLPLHPYLRICASAWNEDKVRREGTDLFRRQNANRKN